MKRSNTARERCHFRDSVRCQNSGSLSGCASRVYSAQFLSGTAPAQQNLQLHRGNREFRKHYVLHIYKLWNHGVRAFR
jgi:hypothetical protein